MNNIVYLNGEYLPKEKAFISPDDRGFYFADGVYEVIKYYKGKAFRFEDHMVRLRRSIGEVRINFTAFDPLENLCQEVIRLNAMEDSYSGVYLQITRGAYQRMHGFPPPSVSPTLYITVYSMHPNVNELTNGIPVILRDDFRWLRCDIKSISLLPNALLNDEAGMAGARGCFLARNGAITETTNANIFGVKENIVYTHPDSNLVLPGITKKVILEICKRMKITVKELPIPAADIPNFDEFFISGTGSEVMPVIRVEERLICEGLPGPVTRKIQHALFEMTYGELGKDWEFRKW